MPDPKKCSRCGRKEQEIYMENDYIGCYYRRIIIKNDLCNYCRAADTRHRKRVRQLLSED